MPPHIQSSSINNCLGPVHFWLVTVSDTLSDGYCSQSTICWYTTTVDNICC